MKKHFMALICLMLLPNLAHGLTDNQKYVLGACVLVCIGGVYYAHNSSPAQTPENDKPSQPVQNVTTDKSENNQNRRPFVRHQKVYGQSEEQQNAQKELQDFVDNRRKRIAEESRKKQAEETSDPKPDLNNPSPSHKPTNSVDKSDTNIQETSTNYFDRLQQGWD
jgi:hypothetical protein